MNRTIANLSALIFMVFASAPAVHAEPTSIRCAEAYGREPYFVTYELEANRLVLETPIDGNFVRGEIVFANEERLELSLRAQGGKILVYYDRKDKIIRWPRACMVQKNLFGARLRICHRENRAHSVPPTRGQA
jgi:hypothetical protein